MIRKLNAVKLREEMNFLENKYNRKLTKLKSKVGHFTPNLFWNIYQLIIPHLKIEPHSNFNQNEVTFIRSLQLRALKESFLSII